jgi:hypothetical protein
MLKWCRDCKHWQPVGFWQGQCPLHPSSKTRWTETAEGTNCPDYDPKEIEKPLTKAKEVNYGRTQRHIKRTHRKKGGNL